MLNPADRTAQRNGVRSCVARFRRNVVARGGQCDRRENGKAASPCPAERERRGSPQARGRDRGGRGGWGGGGRGGGSGKSGGAYAGTLVYPAEAVSLPRTVAPGGFAGGGNVNKEDLGTQVVEGVAATGTRITTTIPAGAIGNEQPILIVSEQWFSPELKVLVMTKHNDPRTGETTYRLTNIVQTEPARSLFEVPADYTLKESVIRRQSPMQPQD